MCSSTFHWICAWNINREMAWWPYSCSRTLSVTANLIYLHCWYTCFKVLLWVFFFNTTASRRKEATHRLPRYLSWRHGNRCSLEGETSAAFRFEQWEAARYGQSWPSRTVPPHGLSNKIACKTKSDYWFGWEHRHWLLSRLYYIVFWNIFSLSVTGSEINSINSTINFSNVTPSDVILMVLPTSMRTEPLQLTVELGGKPQSGVFCLIFNLS